MQAAAALRAVPGRGLAGDRFSLAAEAAPRTPGVGLSDTEAACAHRS
jgi:hypothetical protein